VCACRTSFKDVGKGWYHLGETNQETYEYSKLKRFLQLVRFVMQDTLRFLAEDIMAKFVAFVQVGPNWWQGLGGCW
jgi:dynein heavy chain, axonemal